MTILPAGPNPISEKSGKGKSECASVPATVGLIPHGSSTTDNLAVVQSPLLGAGVLGRWAFLFLDQFGCVSLFYHFVMSWLVSNPADEMSSEFLGLDEWAATFKRRQAVTIERLSRNIPSHTGREVKWQGKAISPLGSSRSIAGPHSRNNQLQGCREDCALQVGTTIHHVKTEFWFVFEARKVQTQPRPYPTRKIRRIQEKRREEEQRPSIPATIDCLVGEIFPDFDISSVPPGPSICRLRCVAGYAIGTHRFQILPRSFPLVLDDYAL
ncbi:hypothetical protein CRG98_015725 [Punica granatum]|uniref:Uncharacterized protein n=1 Tax=Punica granatum TaxID=22663 RepID=A0A2I0K5R1_PUNGR|nr:hypothetical protein CRG98_015725 [Punica granatum]